MSRFKYIVENCQMSAPILSDTFRMPSGPVPFILFTIIQLVVFSLRSDLYKDYKRLISDLRVIGGIKISKRNSDI